MPTTAITWTRFLDHSASTKRELRHEWRELIEHITHAGPYAAKSLCPWIKLARFGEVRSRKGALRHDGNMLEITGVEGDYDGEEIAPELAASRLERAGLRAIVYTSPSHTEERPRWRVLAPLSKAHSPAERTRLLARVNGALGGILTGESFTLSQSFYYGRVEGQGTYRVLCTYDDPEEGTCVDEADQLDAIAVGRPHRAVAADGTASHCIAAEVERLGRRLRTGDARRDLLKRYIGDKSNRGLTADEVRTLVDDVASRFFDPADPLDWSNVNTLITDICDADAGERAQVQATVGPFIERLKEAPQEEAAPAGLPILNIAQLEEASANVTWAVKHIIPADSVGVMFGASGTFKSFVALDYALHCLHGLAWLGKKTKKGPVLFIAAEGGAGVWRRVKAWHLQRGLDWRGIEFYVLPMAVMLNTQCTRVVAAAQELGITPASVIVDTMSQTFDGEENSANEVAAYFRELGNGFRALWRCMVMVIHHSGHAATERPRGSSAILANVDFMLGVFRDEKQMLATLTCEKQKDGERFEPVQFTLSSVQLGKDEDGEPITSLAAKHVNSAEALLEAQKAEAAAGRGGREFLLVSLAQTGMTEKALRHAFYDALDSMDIDSKKKAFYRARDAAKAHGFIDFGTESGSMERHVIVLKEIS